MSHSTGVNRRKLLLGSAAESSSPSKDMLGKTSEPYCISSAVVTLLPGREAQVVASLCDIPGVEVRARQGRKLVLVLEGESSGAVGGLLAQIAVLDGVVSANMVFEHTEIT